MLVRSKISIRENSERSFIQASSRTIAIDWNAFAEGCSFSWLLPWIFYKGSIVATLNVGPFRFD